MSPNVDGAPRAAIIGTGRSGTGYAARLITECAITHGTYCGHEGWWRAIGDPTPGLFCDSSWLALPDIEAGRWAGPVVHLVRDPIDTIASLLRTEFFGAIADTPYPQFARKHCTRADSMMPFGPLAAAVEFWLDWNARCAAVANLTVRIEDLSDWEGGEDSVGAATLALVADTLGVDFGAWQVAAALPTDVNTRPSLTGLPVRVDVDRAWGLLACRPADFGYTR